MNPTANDLGTDVWYVNVINDGVPQYAAAKIVGFIGDPSDNHTLISVFWPDGGMSGMDVYRNTTPGLPQANTWIWKPAS